MTVRLFKSCVDLSCNCKSFNSSHAGSINDCDGDGIVTAEDDDDSYLAECIEPGGNGTTYFSELLNRDISDITLDCDANTSDSDDNICVEDEILLAGSPKPTSTLFSFEDYIGKPEPNRYFQYRVIMEAEENTACDGEPCLPELTSVNLNPNGEEKFFGQTQTVTTKNPLLYKFIRSINIDAESCATFQLSSNGNDYLTWSESEKSWRSPASSTTGSTADEVQDNIRAFAEQFGEGSLYIRTLLLTDGSSRCSLGSFQLETSDLSGAGP